MERVGVLVVHGIGDQHRGASVRQAADALAKALRGTRTVTMADVDVDPEGDRTRPAHLEMMVACPGGESARWLLAESWWARTFDPPTFREVLRWAWRVAPGLLAVEAWRRREVTDDLSLAGALLLVLSPVTVTLLALLVLLSAIPLRRVRDLVGRIQVTLTGTLGDSAVLDDGVVGNAIASRVRSDLDWLARQPGVERVVVVAHSQGAAVAHRVLSADSPVPPGTPLDLVTFGSGLDKLTTARELHDAPARTRLALLAGGLLGGAGTIALAAGVVLAPPWLLFVYLVLALLAVSGVQALAPLARRYHAEKPLTVAIALLWLAAMVAVTLRALSGSPAAAGIGMVAGTVLFGASGRVLRSATSTLAPSPARAPAARTWIEVRSTYDPVPGPVPQGATEIVVDNTRSVLRDHTTYWANAEQFVPLVLGALDVATDPLRHRFTRTALIGVVDAVRLAVVGAAAFAVHALWDRLPRLADDVVSPVLRALSRVPFVDLPDAIGGEDRWALRLIGALLVLAPALAVSRATRAAGDAALARRAAVPR